MYDAEQSSPRTPDPAMHGASDETQPEQLCCASPYAPQRDPPLSRPPDLHPAAVELPAQLVAPPAWGITELVDWAYPDLLVATAGSVQGLTSYYKGRAVLSPTNAAADIVNEHILGLLPVPPRGFLSCDSILPGEASVEHFPLEFLHGLDIAGMPPHRLSVCVGSLLIVLRNYAPHLGVCNGTRVVVAKLGTRMMTVRIVTGARSGDEVLLPKIACDATADTDLPFAFRRYQFPVRAAWAMTINKSQGQAFEERLALYFPRAVFCHGQLYVAFSRATCGKNVRILAEKYDNEQASGALARFASYTSRGNEECREKDKEIRTQTRDRIVEGRESDFLLMRYDKYIYIVYGYT